MDKFYFLKEDYKGLQEEITKLEEEYKRWGKVSTEQGGVGDWHDNAAYDEGMRQMGMLGKRVQELKKIKDLAQILPSEPSIKDKIVFGSKVLIEYEDSGEELKVIIGSYMIFRKDGLTSIDGYKLISYETPLAVAILGKEIDETVYLNIGEKKRELIILDIT